ncbi:MAG: serine/threonine-protein kinase [Thermoanaerobaculales bacterium]|jgi:serine/threonine-protein kinase|nr:serine/threonine-protein kinase [Thermoanaerobaculales bacterium]
MAEPISESRWRAADRILDRVLDSPAERRRAVIAEVCGDDEELRTLVERLVARCEGDDTRLGPGGALDGAFAAAVGRELADGSAELRGALVGRYRVLRELGRGGMAVVYLAERADDDFHQLVALKLIQPGADGEHMLERFHRERQILALARHPNIAQLLDAGITADGRSFIVMELVEGEPVDVFCDARRLGLRRRLRIFLEIARAVEYAHRNLVVHRDIKPSNILVTGDGDVKLLDFGIAKLLDDDAAEHTRTHLRAMTPAFASPEQISGGAITTATDIYQLGVLLYLLLTGCWPYAAGSPATASVLLAIRELAPLRPSTAVGGRREPTPLPGRQAPTAGEIAASRSAPASRLRRELDGDLDTIVLTCLRKAPERRYPSVAQLIVDIERFLDGRTISARPDTIGYRLSTFVRRHSAATATAAASAVVVVGLVGFSTFEVGRERDRARLEAAKAGEVSTFLHGLFQVSAPNRSRGEQVTARELLDRGAERIETELAGQPELQAAMMTVIGDTYRELAHYDEAGALLERAVEIRRRHPGDRELDLAASLFALGRVHERLRDTEAARAVLEEALALREAALGPAHPDTARVRDVLGLVASYDGDLETARRLHEEAVADLAAALGKDHVDYGAALNRLAGVVQDQREFEASIVLFDEAIAVLERSAGDDHPYTAAAKFNLAHSLRNTGQIERADALYTEVLPLIARGFGPEHPAVGMVLNNHSNLLREQGRLDEAEAKLGQAMAIWTAALGPDHPQVGWIFNNLGLIATERGDHLAARDHFQRSVDIAEAAYGPDHADVATQLKNLGGALHALGDSEAAIPLMERALAIRERVYGSDHSYVGAILRELAVVRLDLGDHPGAIADLERAIPLGRDGPDHRHDEVTMPTIQLARTLAAIGRTGEAAARLEAERSACLESSRPAVDAALAVVKGSPSHRESVAG